MLAQNFTGTRRPTNNMNSHYTIMHSNLAVLINARKRNLFFQIIFKFYIEREGTVNLI